MALETDRFIGSRRKRGERLRLQFDALLPKLGQIEKQWAFIENRTLRKNIACELQKVEFDLLLINTYEVYLGPEAMTLKRSIIAVASVVEAVLHVQVAMLTDHPIVGPLLKKVEWANVETKPFIPQSLELADDLRIVTAVQRRVPSATYDDSSPMASLIRWCKTGEAIDDSLADRLNELRRLRNRVHIKTLDDKEYDKYTVDIANDALETLEELRQRAKVWIGAQQPSETARVPEPPVPALPVGWLPDDDIPF